jgi:hypothetical protein
MVREQITSDDGQSPETVQSRKLLEFCWNTELPRVDPVSSESVVNRKNMKGKQLSYRRSVPKPAAYDGLLELHVLWNQMPTFQKLKHSFTSSLYRKI